MKKGTSSAKEAPQCYDKSFQVYYNIGCPQKIGGSNYGSN